MYYLIKRVFLHKLRMCEIRLCTYLTSKNVDYISIPYKDKLWICGGRPNDASNLRSMVSNLISLGLLNEDGFGLSVVENEFVIVSHALLSDVSTQKELFVKVLPKWYINGSFISIKKEYINLMLGSNKSDRNKTIKRLSKSLNIDINLEERSVDFLYNKPKSNTKSKKPYLQYKEYLQTEHWLTLSTKIKEDVGKCQLCGSTHRLEVHHNNYDNLWNETSKDLIVLCHECHSKFHDKL